MARESGGDGEQEVGGSAARSWFGSAALGVRPQCAADSRASVATKFSGGVTPPCASVASNLHARRLTSSKASKSVRVPLALARPKSGERAGRKSTVAAV